MAGHRNDLTEFLNRHGLGTYAELLARNGIDLGNLPLLTSADFRELGLPLVDRRRILSAAAAGQQAGDGAAGTDAATPGERRRLTVMFCDIAGATALSVRLDPEDYADLIHDFIQRATRATEQFGGHVAKILGDGVLACFGYPLAHEDDPERAILAAQDCLRRIATAPFETDAGEPVPIRVRIGIHTGIVIVSTTGEDGHSTEELMGHAANVAQRIQAQAAPGEILVGERTRKLAGDRFDYAGLEPRWLRGIDGPVRLYRVKRANPSRTRFEIRNSARFTPMVGRRAEIAGITALWREVVAGQGRAVLISGRAGIGKSRLSRAFLDGIRLEAKTLVTLQCSPHHMGTPLFPVISRLHQHLDNLIAGGCNGRADALAAWLAQAGLDNARNRALAAALLSVDMGESVPPLDMRPRKQREAMLTLLLDHAAALSRAAPVLLWIEDHHWADPSTRALVALSLDRLDSARIMLLTTFRTKAGRPPPVDRFDAHIALAPLARGELAQLIRNAARPVTVPETASRTIIARSAGVPLFAEELARSAVRQMTDTPGRAAGASGTQDWRVPESLVDSLAAQLDSLPTAKYLAQIAAAIGRKPDKTLLRRVAGYGPARFDRAIAELTEAQMILPRAHSEPNRVVFRHALIQDVAYQLMLRRDRRRIHARIAEALEAGGADMPPPLPEVLAYHYEAAQEPERAVRYLLAAGTGAVRRSAHPEARALLEHALTLVAGKTRIPRDRARALERRIRRAIASPLIATGGHGSGATVHALQRAEEIARQLGDDHGRLHAQFGLWGHRWTAGHVGRSLRVAHDMLQTAQTVGTDEALVLAHRCAGSSCWIMGDIAQALHHLDQVIGLTIDTDPSALANRNALCPCIVAQVLGGHGSWPPGDRSAAFARIALGLARATRRDRAYSLALSHSMMGGISLLAADLDALEAHAAMLQRIGEDRRFPYWLHYARSLRGALVARRGDPGRGRALITQADAARDAIGVFIHRTIELVLLSDIAAITGDDGQARNRLDEARALGHQTGERQWFAVINARLDALDRRAAAPQRGP